MKLLISEKQFSVVYADNPKAMAYCITKFRDTSDAAGTLAYGAMIGLYYVMPMLS